MKARWGAAAGACLGLGAYALYEPYRFRLVTQRVPVARNLPDVSILHLSDTHFAARDRHLSDFLESVAKRVDVPDLVIATGDLIQNDSGIDRAIDALSLVEARAGRFYVLGSHDYLRSTMPNYAKYFTGRRRAIRPQHNDYHRLEEGLQNKGWRPLHNATAQLEVGGASIRLAGVDDPYLDRHRTDHLHTETGHALSIGVMHSPDIVSEFVLAGFELILAGHTHAGQVRLPGIGAVVTNCRLPGELAGGMHRVGRAWLHVSPGLGSGSFTPIRFNARPEATLLEIRSAAASSS